MDGAWGAEGPVREEGAGGPPWGEGPQQAKLPSPPGPVTPGRERGPGAAREHYGPAACQAARPVPASAWERRVRQDDSLPGTVTAEETLWEEEPGPRARHSEPATAAFPALSGVRGARRAPGAAGRVFRVVVRVPQSRRAGQGCPAVWRTGREQGAALVAERRQALARPAGPGSLARAAAGPGRAAALPHCPRPMQRGRSRRSGLARRLWGPA